MLQDVDLVVPWLALNVSGEWCLVILLVTYACAAWLPQRNNAYLVNFILATFLGTVPPSLLLYSGRLYSSVPSSLCVAQASLVIGTIPMSAVAQLALVFDSWSELRHLAVHKTHISRTMFVKCVALIAPYFTFGFWTFAAYQVMLSSTVIKSNELPWSSVSYVYCRPDGPLAFGITTASGIFFAILTAIQVFFEIWVAWMIYAYPTKVHDDPTTWRTSIHFSLRVIIFSMLQLVIQLIIGLNTIQSIHSDALKRGSELLTSMNALAAFLVIGAQTNVLQTWKYALMRLWDFVTRKEPEDPDEPQPQGFPVLDWAYLPRKETETADVQSLNSLENGEGGLIRKKMTLPKFVSRLKLPRRGKDVTMAS